MKKIWELVLEETLAYMREAHHDIAGTMVERLYDGKGLKEIYETEVKHWTGRAKDIWEEGFSGQVELTDRDMEIITAGVGQYINSISIKDYLR